MCALAARGQWSPGRFPVTLTAEARREAMRMAVRECPECHRRGMFSREWASDKQAYVMRCHYCGTSWLYGFDAKQDAQVTTDGA